MGGPLHRQKIINFFFIFLINLIQTFLSFFMCECGEFNFVTTDCERKNKGNKQLKKVFLGHLSLSPSLALAHTKSKE